MDWNQEHHRKILPKPHWWENVFELLNLVWCVYLSSQRVDFLFKSRLRFSLLFNISVRVNLCPFSLKCFLTGITSVVFIILFYLRKFLHSFYRLEFCLGYCSLLSDNVLTRIRFKRLKFCLPMICLVFSWNNISWGTEFFNWH